MKFNKTLRFAAILAGSCFGLSAATTLTECPAATIAGSAYTGCNFTVIANSNGTYTSVIDTTQPFFGGEDVYAGFLNNSTKPVSSIMLNGLGVNIFGFDGDGPSLFPGSTGYEGPDNTFSNISADMTMGTVNFTTPIAPGASTYFFLEGSFTTPPVAGTPEPASIALLGGGLLSLGGIVLRRRRNS